MIEEVSAEQVGNKFMPSQPDKARTLKYMEELRHLCHEIRQPLTVILLLAETGALKGLETDESNTIYNAGIQSREALLRIQEVLYEWQEFEESVANAFEPKDPSPNDDDISGDD
jgi:signal transduction histidine kinase